MAQLEYRLLDRQQDYPVLFEYDKLDGCEVAARFACDRLIKGGTVYEKTSCAIEPLVHVIYVQQAGASEKTPPAPPPLRGVRIELRQDWEGETPGLLIQTFDYTDGLEVVLHLQCDYWFWLGEEWLRTMSVLDEDRRVYVCYVKRAKEVSG